MPQSLGDMDVDQDFDYDLASDDLLLIEQTEQIYLNTQQSQQPSLSTATPLRNEPSGSKSWNPAQEAIGQVDWNPPQETVKQQEETIEIAESNIDTIPIGSTSTSRFGPEAERIFENYRFQIERLQMNAHNTNGAQQQQAEVLQLREMLKDKERDLIQLKKELYKYKEQSSDPHQQKRAFPGFNVYDRPKPKRISTRPSPFSQAAASFSQSRASPSPSFSSQATSSQLESISNDRNNVRMPRLSSLASPLINPALKQVANVKAEPELPVLTKEVILNDAPTVTVDRRKPNSPRKIRKPTETENKQKLLTVLLTPHFQQWNMKEHNNTKDINTALTRPLTKKFSEEFSQQFVPDPGQTAPRAEYERLQLLASDINNSLLKGESTNGTIRLLLNILNLTLKIVIKCKLYKIIYHIANVSNTLTANFTIARQYLQRDITIETNSLLAQFATSLSLLPIHQTQRPHLLSHVANSGELSFEDIDRLMTTFNTKPSQIYKDLHTERSTGETLPIVKSILELFLRVGSGCKDPIFTFLLADSSFLNLLDRKRPHIILYSAMSVLETSLTNELCLVDYNDKELHVVRCLTDLINSYSNEMESFERYKICLKAFALIELILLADLPEKQAIEASRIVLEKVNEAMDSMAARYVRNAGHLTNSIREQRDDFIKFGLQAIYACVKWCPNNVFEHTKELQASTVLQMVYFFQANMQVNPSLSKICTRLVQLLTPKKAKPLKTVGSK